jgi:UDP-glucose 4-epimerase
MSNAVDIKDFRRYFIVGGAGYIGRHFTDRLLADSGVTAVMLYDNGSPKRTTDA